MSGKRLIVTMGGTALCALGAGFFIQSSARPQTPAAPRPAMMQMAEVTPAAAAPITVIPDIQTAPDTDEPADLSGIRLTSTQSDVHTPKPMPVPDLDAAGFAPKIACNVTARAEAMPLAMVRLDVSAPCLVNERLTVHHSGMMFTEITDEHGHVSVGVPALAEKAVFIVAFPSGKGAVATAHVSDLANVDRIALQWSGRAGFELHALEFGAGYDDPGHVWYQSTTAAGATSGRMVRLGETGPFAPQFVDIYSVPATEAARTGTIALSVEAEVTADNCGRDVTAQALELRNGSGLRTRELSMSMPGCDAQGDFLVLNNLVDDLKIASR